MWNFSNPLNRRDMLRASVVAAAASALPKALMGAESPKTPSVAGHRIPGLDASALGLQEGHYPFTLPALPYGTDALEAAVDTQTMEIHHGRHHQGYVNKLNAALEGHSELHSRTLTELVSGWDNLPEAVQAAVRNSGGGHLNHTLFWPSLSPSGGGEPTGPLAGAIQERFGSFAAFRDTFSRASGGVFGSGWGWLVAEGSGRLEVVTTPNQDNPISKGMAPLLGLDVWEHAYYLRYQNRRADYVQAFWKVVNWETVADRFRAI